MNQKIRVFSGNSNRSLAESICANLGLPLGKANVKTFSDGEVMVEIGENVRGRDTYVVQSTCAPTNNNLMELLIMMDALKRASAATITAVIPYYGYARQDRKVAPRTPITSKLVADLITTAGADRVVTVDLHAGQIQGFFNIPVDNLYAAPVILEHLKQRFPENSIVMVSPDAGGTERARAFAKRLGCTLAVIDKRRTGPNVAEVMHLIGDVTDKTAIILDDMIDTAGTLTQAARALKEHGAKTIYACATHGVLSGPAIERINNSDIEAVVITDTVPLGDKEQQTSKVKVLSVANLLAEAIRRIHEDESVSSLFV
ncbi:ribose-phosphate pyrophosphokinase [Geobacter sulfurreducens]|uniref:Ribose-phosphate pyrophosphokinase n=1 Tax=Geobacter sulfurreducens (strain ATCC 51573 / DSM 12127 / PCA) TaxID=243231 RepID=Q74FE8_GEOSL|nr:ribose-phosphate pyrophosphokinase [Geobacter sulfurreducens]AAR33991.1 ribose-5-phosphate 1-pyrophosphokinase [Geobacter sulfurreducens PCA]ADI83500.2 ribose-5-phosphate 1-pyrophosphokinase [Geobacter sulfurreducens KN400]AJY70409.1 phosphoribosylpyrophosphate synthetase [Geobacter sulfurreducens]QVW35900.1 ribose-phosphate pyrophosphokinase [Geobacter sulfurreducens]UAC04725.1 ribose-phosphate pyrophosphokinase [Geobacter sulfurreducens]